jgi:hypothetical protein
MTTGSGRVQLVQLCHHTINKYQQVRGLMVLAAEPAHQSADAIALDIVMGLWFKRTQVYKSLLASGGRKTHYSAHAPLPVP